MCEKMKQLAVPAVIEIEKALHEKVGSNEGNYRLELKRLYSLL